VAEDSSLPSQDEMASARTELQRHLEHLFRKAGDSPEVIRLRLAVLDYRASRTQNVCERVPE
jgi:hypothetical protein